MGGKKTKRGAKIKDFKRLHGVAKVRKEIIREVLNSRLGKGEEKAESVSLQVVAKTSL